MSDIYIQVAVFALLAVFLPISLLIFSKLVRPNKGSNKVQRQNYESAEESIGDKVTVMNEYLHYFSMFMAFEVIGIIVIIWSAFSRQLLESKGIYVIALLVFGLFFELLILGLIKSKGE
jgi:NADH:ubiquinone oxidoreductase subunit 3 (subunit A)